MAIRPGFDRRIAVACFGAACAVGLVFAFIGLDTHSFWYDELFTAQLLQPAPDTTLLARIATDVHPPVYLVALSLFTQLFGDGDAALRGFSAVAAVGAIVVFVTATGGAFSLPGRLFGAAMATGSLFWFFQAQNARSYALCLLIGAGVLALGLPLLREGGRRRLTVPGLLALMIVGSFVHFYVMYVCLAVLILLAVLERRDRVLMIAAALFLLVAAGLYVKLVIEPLSQVSLGNNWYPNDLRWYLAVLQSCVRYSFGDQGLVALALCAVGIVCSRFLPSRERARPRPDRATMFLAGVPLLVAAGGIVSSTLLAPNFFDRNLLVASPFLWGLAARAYDAAVEKASPALGAALTGALAVIVLSMSSIVTSRLPSGVAPAIYEPYRQSAAWIRSLPVCRGQIVPVISPDDPAWYRPGYAAFIYEGGYGRYLQGFARPQLVFSRDLSAERFPAGLKAELQQRLDGAGCPVLAWAAHNMSPKTIAALEERLLAALDRRDAATAIAATRFDDGSVGYVLQRIR